MIYINFLTVQNKFRLVLLISCASQILFPAAAWCSLSPLVKRSRLPTATQLLSPAQPIKKQLLEGVVLREEDPKLTAELEKLYEKTNDFSWFANSLIMQRLIKDGASPNVKNLSDSLLLDTCLKNDIELIKVCLAHGVLLEDTDLSGFTAVSFCKSAPALELLLEAGANFNHQNRSQKTALHSAVTQNRSVKVLAFLFRYIVLSCKNGIDTPLHSLCVMNDGLNDFGKKVAIVLWGSPEQLLIENEYGGKRPAYYLQRNPVELDELLKISKDITKAQVQLKEEESEELGEIVERFVPIHGIGKLVTDYSGLPDISLQGKGSREVGKIVERFVPVTPVAELINSYSGPSYFSLQYFMEKEGSELKYPALARVSCDGSKI